MKFIRSVIFSVIDFFIVSTLYLEYKKNYVVAKINNSIDFDVRTVV